MGCCLNIRNGTAIAAPAVWVSPTMNLCTPSVCYELDDHPFSVCKSQKIEVQLIFDLLGGSTCRTTCKLILFEKCQNNFVHTIVCKKLTIKLYFG